MCSVVSAGPAQRSLLEPSGVSFLVTRYFSALKTGRGDVPLLLCVVSNISPSGGCGPVRHGRQVCAASVAVVTLPPSPHHDSEAKHSFYLATELTPFMIYIFCACKETATLLPHHHHHHHHTSLRLDTSRLHRVANPDIHPSIKLSIHPTSCDRHSKAMQGNATNSQSVLRRCIPTASLFSFLNDTVLRSSGDWSPSHPLHWMDKRHPRSINRDPSMHPDLTFSYTHSPSPPHVTLPVHES
ncbi:hypothetical protein E2C01_024358 [Portunus trituberculatus]|uniref:Uncharacterized protein n=1 Tax=Portunus trituberculatus TaxID=210409 RepID=A0A5B7EAG3_PORTR|nr:hypothetical protein [Portunus trituberculatus]